jgi:hypothetical protein
MRIATGLLRWLARRPGLLVGLVLAIAATAHAGNDELSLGSGARALRSSSANALTDDNLAGAAFGYARDLGITAPGLALWVEAGVTIDGARGTMFQTVTTDIGVVGVTAGLRARGHLHRRIAASARLDVGGQRVDVALGDRGGEASDHGWGAMASAGAAIDLLAVAQRSFAFGVRLDVGYVAARAVSLTMQRDTPGETLELAMTELAFGSLDLGGPTFAASLIAQF